MFIRLALVAVLIAGCNVGGISPTPTPERACNPGSDVLIQARTPLFHTGLLKSPMTVQKWSGATLHFYTIFVDSQERVILLFDADDDEAQFVMTKDNVSGFVPLYVIPEECR
jgi:hypothetical protein